MILSTNLLSFRMCYCCDDCVDRQYAMSFAALTVISSSRRTVLSSFLQTEWPNGWETSSSLSVCVHARMCANVHACMLLCRQILNKYLHLSWLLYLFQRQRQDIVLNPELIGFCYSVWLMSSRNLSPLFTPCHTVYVRVHVCTCMLPHPLRFHDAMTIQVHVLAPEEQTLSEPPPWPFPWFIYI